MARDRRPSSCPFTNITQALTTGSAFRANNSCLFSKARKFCGFGDTNIGSLFTIIFKLRAGSMRMADAWGMGECRLTEVMRPTSPIANASFTTIADTRTGRLSTWGTTVLRSVNYYDLTDTLLLTEEWTTDAQGTLSGPRFSNIYEHLNRHDPCYVKIHS
jgi:hypothetical protein